MNWRPICLFACLATACSDDTTDDRTGDACEGPGDCGGLACVAREDWRGDDLERFALACGSERQGLDTGEACERGAQCASGVCLLAGGCASACEGADDCGDFERCQQVYARGRGERLHPLEACVAMVDLGAGAQVRVETRPDAFSGGIDELDLPPTSAATLFVIEHLDDDSWPVPSSSTSCRPALCADALEPREPDAEPWFERMQLTAASGPINPIAVGDHVYPLTILVPAGPRAQPPAAGYRLRLESKRAGRARLTTVRREPGSGQLNLNLYYAGTDAEADAIAAALEEVDRIFEPAGVFLGERREIRVTGELLTRGSDLPEAEASRGFARLRLQYRVYPQLPELFKLSAGAGNRALDVFFVETIDAAGADIGGMAGSTPVPFGMHGTGASGVVIATGGVSDDPAQLGRRIAHEVGHALGLFHTIETTGDVLDPLPDTPVEGGEANLMFPAANGGVPELTPGQASVLQRAMLLD